MSGQLSHRRSSHFFQLLPAGVGVALGIAVSLLALAARGARWAHLLGHVGGSAYRRERDTPVRGEFPGGNFHDVVAVHFPEFGLDRFPGGLGPNHRTKWGDRPD
jgi:hypothetical protein